VQVTETVELPLTAVVMRLVPEVAGNASVAALMVHAAVMIIETLRLAVAVPACAFAQPQVARQDKTTSRHRRTSKARRRNGEASAAPGISCVTRLSAPRTGLLHSAMPRSIPYVSPSRRARTRPGARAAARRRGFTSGRPKSSRCSSRRRIHARFPEHDKRRISVQHVRPKWSNRPQSHNQFLWGDRFGVGPLDKMHREAVDQIALSHHRTNCEKQLDRFEPREIVLIGDHERRRNEFLDRR
jgi:hypothetical protein